MSRITTHVLDTTRGLPGSHMEVILYRKAGEAWEEMAQGVTDPGGRIAAWSSVSGVMDPGIYKMRFETEAYFALQGTRHFYPFVEVHFEVATENHYHIPLLLSPYGYSTYRGS